MAVGGFSLNEVFLTWPDRVLALGDSVWFGWFKQQDSENL